MKRYLLTVGMTFFDLMEYVAHCAHWWCYKKLINRDL